MNAPQAEYVAPALALLFTSSVDLHDGWNLITENIRNSLHSFLVFAGEAKPNTKKLALYDKNGGSEKLAPKTKKA